MVETVEKWLIKCTRDPNCFLSLHMYGLSHLLRIKTKSEVKKIKRTDVSCISKSRFKIFEIHFGLLSSYIFWLSCFLNVFLNGLPGF